MKALLFDFGGTLDSDGLTWKDRFFSIYREAGIDVPQDRFDRAFYDADDHLAARHRLEGLTLPQTVSLQVEDVLTRLDCAKEGVGARISDRFVDDCRGYFERNRPVLTRLKRRYRLGIVSNFYGNLPGILSTEGLSDLFGVVADSTLLGHAKPAPEIFLFAAGKLGAEPGECLMVGDSIPRDMKGAEGLGMSHALLTSANAACCAQAWKLRRFPELESLLS